jgi:hypothetical protein
MKINFILWILPVFISFVACERERVKFRSVRSPQSAEKIQPPLEHLKVLLAIKIKNHAYSLPTFLATLERLECPTENKKCDLWVIFDECTDQSYDLFIEWLSNTRPLFDTIIMIDTNNDQSTKEKHVLDLPSFIVNHKNICF